MCIATFSVMFVNSQAAYLDLSFPSTYFYYSHFSCECMEGFDGPNCEVVGIGFYGDGYALYPPFQACAEAHLTMELRPYKPDGLVFYVGPMKHNPALLIQGKLCVKQKKRYVKLVLS